MKRLNLERDSYILKIACRGITLNVVLIFLLLFEGAILSMVFLYSDHCMKGKNLE